MKVNKIVLLGLCITLLFCSCEKLLNLSSSDASLTNEEVISGLKEALQNGTSKGVSILKETDGYYKDELVKILLPQEAQIIIETMEKLGLEDEVEDVVKKINASAEHAVEKASPIFVSAITSMTISDGFKILNGTSTEATNYLKSTTYTNLTNAFTPDIQNTLSEKLLADISASEAYASLVDTYNAAIIPLNLLGGDYPPISSNSLTSYVTSKALDGLFLKIADQEEKIRKDPLEQVSELLKKVFGSVN